MDFIIYYFVSIVNCYISVLIVDWLVAQIEKFYFLTSDFQLYNQISALYKDL